MSFQQQTLVGRQQALLGDQYSFRHCLVLGLHPSQHHLRLLGQYQREKLHALSHARQVKAQVDY
jgi:hypothetical protein